MLPLNGSQNILNMLNISKAYLHSSKISKQEDLVPKM